jgi:hypothetical protein
MSFASDSAIPAAALADLESLYRDFETELARHQPRCELSGRCCDFERAGHELFVTDLEVAYARAHATVPPANAPAKLCPYWQAGRCELRSGRPFGCRVYFCNKEFAEAMPELAERFHRRIVELHEKHGVTYRYRRFVVSIREAQ